MESWIRGIESRSTIPQCGSQDPDLDPRQTEMDSQHCIKALKNVKHEMHSKEKIWYHIIRLHTFNFQYIERLIFYGHNVRMDLVEKNSDRTDRQSNLQNCFPSKRNV